MQDTAFIPDDHTGAGREFRFWTHIADWYRRRRLFSRVLMWIVMIAVGLQGLDVGLVLLVRLPPPRGYPLHEVATALTSGRPSAALSVAMGQPPAAQVQDSRDRQVAERLAAMLELPAGGVRVSISRPPLSLKGKDGSHRPAPGVIAATSSRSGTIIGHFTAALRMNDGRWRIVHPRQAGLEPWQWQMILWLVGTTLIAAALSWILARGLTAPIALFAAAAERLGRDPGSRPLPVGGPPEIAVAARAFNAMQESLRHHMNDRATMVAAIAHDLKTPLTRLRLLLDDAPDGVREAADEHLREVTKRIDDVQAFVRGIRPPERRQRLNLRALIETVADGMVDAGADVWVEEGQGATIDADPAGIRALFTNLLENAVRYAQSAHVHLICLRHQVIVEVVDRGPGIPEAELERVFEPFHRVESSRNRATGGTGLGLTSARAIARAHGGDVVLCNRAKGGLLARVTLPRCAPALQL